MKTLSKQEQRVMEKMISIVKEKSADVVLPGLTNTYVSKEILLKLLQEAYSTYDAIDKPLTEKETPKYELPMFKGTMEALDKLTIIKK